MAVGDLLEVRFICRFDNQISINVRHYEIASETPGAVSSLDIADSLSQAFAPLYQACLADRAQYRGCGVRKIRPIPVEAEVLSALGQGPGLVVGEALPRQICGLISFRTNSTDVARRGRLYVPFPSEVDNEASAFPGVQYQANLTILGTTMAALAFAGAPGQETTLAPHIKAGATDNSHLITGFIVRPLWATQRRRGDFGAINPPPV